jgi:hypothetical protein
LPALAVKGSHPFGNLPALIEDVADVSNGDSIVVTEPMDPSGYSGFRLFYGAPGQMIERGRDNVHGVPRLRAIWAGRRQ